MQMCNIFCDIMEEKFRVLDGGTATELIRLGATEIDSDPLWSARLLHTQPQLIKQVHKNFLEAGSETLVTVSYQASVDGFCKHLQIENEEALNLIKLGTKLAREACLEVKTGNKPVIVAGSVGPYGACLCDGSEYTGIYADKLTTQELIDWHRPRIKALIDSECDILGVETIPVQREAEAVVELLKEFPTSKAWVTFSCKDGEYTHHGERFSDAVRSVLQSSNVVAVGINCTSPEYVSSLLSSIQHLSLTIPVIVKPNSGEKWERGRGFYGISSCKPLCSFVQEWTALGATWIGGCCRIYPDDIKMLKSVLDQM